MEAVKIKKKNKSKKAPNEQKQISIVENKSEHIEKTQDVVKVSKDENKDFTENVEDQLKENEILDKNIRVSNDAFDENSVLAEFGNIENIDEEKKENQEVVEIIPSSISNKSFKEESTGIENNEDDSNNSIGINDISIEFTEKISKLQNLKLEENFTEILKNQTTSMNNEDGLNDETSHLKKINDDKLEKAQDLTKSSNKENLTTDKILEIREALLAQLSKQKNNSIENKTDDKQIELINFDNWFDQFPFRFASDYIEQFLDNQLSQFNWHHPLFTMLNNYLIYSNKLNDITNKIDNYKLDFETNQNYVYTINNQKVTKRVLCRDGEVFTFNESFLMAKLNQDIVTSIISIFENLKISLHEDYTLALYLFHLNKIEIETYVERLINGKINLYKEFGKTTFDKMLFQTDKLNQIQMDNTNDLTLALSILFYFQRRSKDNIEFEQLLFEWTKKIVSVLVRIASWKDHLFLLNHLLSRGLKDDISEKNINFFLRLPKNLIEPMSNFIQVPFCQTIDCSIENDLSIKHIVTVLATLLQPIKQRDQFLYQSDPNKGDAISTNWILLDSEDEEVEEANEETTNELKCLNRIRETNLLAILNQIPFKKLFERLFSINKNELDEDKLLKLIGWCTCNLLKCFYIGFKSYAPKKNYQLLLKHLARLVTHLIQYITDMFILYREENDHLKSEDMERIQLEYDMFVLKCVELIFSTPIVWQFLPKLPFDQISIKTLWIIYYILHSNVIKTNVVSLVFCQLYSKNIEELLETEEVKEKYEELLNRSNPSELYYLLETFANMITAKQVKSNMSIVRHILKNLLHVGYLNESTKKLCAKSVRDLLSLITSQHPFLISHILFSIQSNIHIIGKLSLYLFKELCLEQWQPNESDFEILSKFLIHSEISSNENCFARYVLSNLNWDVSNGNFVLNGIIHKRIALLILSATITHYDNTKSETVSGGNQLLPNSLSNYLNGTDFVDVWLPWTWKLINDLKLHQMDSDFDHAHIVSCIQRPASVFNQVSDIEKIEIVLKGLEKKLPLASYLSILLTQWGHSVPLICFKGFEQMKILLDNLRYTEVIHSIYLVVPLFVNCQQSLYESPKFQDIINGILLADYTGYIKMTKDLISGANEPGENLLKLCTVIENHLIIFTRYGLTNPELFLKLWLNILLKSCGQWQQNLNVLFLLNRIIRVTYFYGNQIHLVYDELFRKQIQDNKQQVIENKSNESKLKSLVSWMSNGNCYSFSLVTDQCLNNFHWLSIVLLSIEFDEFELKTNLWPNLINAIFEDKNKNLNDALKKTIKDLNLIYFGNVNNLTIHRLFELSQKCAYDLELLPIVYQKFFYLLLERNTFNHLNTTKTVSSYRTIMGIKLFNSSQINLIQTNLDQAIGILKSATPPNSFSIYSNVTLQLLTNYKDWITNDELFKNYQKFLIPNESFSYKKLKLVFNNDQNLWLEYLNYSEFFKSLYDNNKFSEQIIQRKQKIAKTIIVTTRKNSETSFERINLRLKSYDQPKSPPELPIIQELYLGIPNEALLQFKSLRKFFLETLSVVLNYSKEYNLTVNEHSAINIIYLELMQELYKQRTTTISKQYRCGVVCKGTANLTLKVTYWEIDKMKERERQDNREKWKQLVEKCYNTYPNKLYIHCFLIKDLTMKICEKKLEFNVNDADQHKEIMKLQKLASPLFYYFIDMVASSDVYDFPPLQNIFSYFACQISLNFIKGWDCETVRLIETILKLNNDLLSDYLIKNVFEMLYNNQNFNFLNGLQLIVDNVSDQFQINKNYELLIKFKIKDWLNGYKRSLNERTKLIDIIFKGLLTFGPDMDQVFSNIYSDLLKKLIIIFEHDWPEHYGDIIKKLLSSNSTNEKMGIRVDVWWYILNALEFTKPADGQNEQILVEQLRLYAVQQNMLSFDILMESAILVNRYFSEDRLQFGLHGLYPRYRNYIQPLSIFFAMLAHALIVKTIQHYPALLANQLFEMLWSKLIEIWSAWLICYTKHKKLNVPNQTSNWIQQFQASGQSNGVLVPWVEFDNKLAQIVINAFVISINFLLDSLPGFNNGLSYVWQFYCEHYAHGYIEDYIVNAINEELIKLPWQKFWPSVNDLQLMFKLVNEHLTECNKFIGAIIVRINWSSWLDSLYANQTTNTTIISIAQTHLLPICVQLSYQVPNMTILLKQLIKYDWHLLTIEMFKALVEFFCVNCDCRVVLHQIPDVKQNDVLILNQLKLISLFESKTNENEKRLIFIRLYVRLIVKCNECQFDDKSKIDLFTQSIVNVLNEFKQLPISSKIDELSELISELLCLIYNKNLIQIVTCAIQQWLVHQKTSSHVIMACVNSFVKHIQLIDDAHFTNETSHFIELLELTIERYFELDETANWNWLVDVIVTKNETRSSLWCTKQFLQFSISTSSLLVAHLILIVIKSKNISLHPDQFFQILFSQLKPICSNESKLPLIWKDFLTNLFSNRETLNESDRIEMLRRFSKQLQEISDEKITNVGWGSSILGAIGLQKKPESFSIRGRFVCKALAVYIDSQICDDDKKIRFEANCRYDIVSLDPIKSFTQNEIKIYADYALKQVINRGNSMHNVDEFINNISKQLYNKLYLAK